MVQIHTVYWSPNDYFTCVCSMNRQSNLTRKQWNFIFSYCYIEVKKGTKGLHSLQNEIKIVHNMKLICSTSNQHQTPFPFREIFSQEIFITFERKTNLHQDLITTKKLWWSFEWIFSLISYCSLMWSHLKGSCKF